MPFILAIESDKRQAARITAIARSLNGVELEIVESVLQALETLSARVPTLILTPLLLSPKDSTALDDRLRELDAAGKQVQTLMTPMLASASQARKPAPKTGLLMRLRKTTPPSSPDGCEPSVFAAQITEYLDRARDQQSCGGAHQSPGDHRPLDEAVADPPRREATDTVPAFIEEFAVHASVPETPEPPLMGIDAEAAPLPDTLHPSAIFAERLADLSPPRDRHDLAPAAAETLDEPIVTTWSAMPWPEAPVPIPTDDPALAAEVAAILATPSPSMTAGEEWVDVDMDLLAAHPDHAPLETVVDAAPMAAPDPSDATPVDTAPAPAADDFDVSEFVRALEASLAVDVPTKKQRRKRAVVARKPAPERDVQEDEPEPSFDDYDPNADLWMPLPAVARAIWPQLDSALSVVRPAAGQDSPGGSPAGESIGEGSIAVREGTRKKRQAPVTKIEPDEWGLFDPQQCGFAALLAKLDQVTDTPSE